MEKVEKLKGASTLVSFYLAILMIEYGVMAWLFSLFGGEFMFSQAIQLPSINLPLLSSTVHQ